MADSANSSPGKLSNLEKDDVEIPVRQEFENNSCKAETVVVYLDRAEICRSLRTKVRDGENEILLKNMSPCIERDSIRVEGKGSASITEVAFQTRHLATDEVRSSTAAGQVRSDLMRKNKYKSKLIAKQQRLVKQRNVLDVYVESLMKAGQCQTNDTKEKTKQETLLQMLEGSTTVLEGISTLFENYDKSAARLDDYIDQLQQDIDICQSQVDKLEKTLNDMNVEEDEKEATDLLILLEASELGEVELYISYVVSKAHWTPKYDIRVFSNDSTMKILYYALIQQATGENWDDTKLCLSTAMPSIGGTLPELGTQRLAFKPRADDGDLTPHKKRTFGRKARRLSGRITMNMMKEESVDERLESFQSYLPPDRQSLCVYEDASLQDSDSPHIEVKESITSTMYEIARRSTIPCDNVTHKVSVAIIDLRPTFEYESVPRKAAHAFLKAKVKNTSPYALLAGPANIFLDNNFVSKAELKPVSPMEEFTCSLGVDPSVRVLYRPLHKYREQSGLLTKTVVTTYRQVIDVKNTHHESIRILVSDQLPLSMEERIKIQLQEPVIKHPERYDVTKPVRLNKLNNIEWDLEIQPNEQKELVLKYTIEYPATEELETSTTHSSEC